MLKKIINLVFMLAMVFGSVACNAGASDLQRQIGELENENERQSERIGELEDERGIGFPIPDDGLSAYDIYLKYHPEYEGDEERWLCDLVNDRLAHYTVTFDSNGGSPVDSVVNLAKGDRLVAPDEPTKDGHIFNGWYNERKCVNEWAFEDDEVLADTTLYAKWERVFLFRADLNYAGAPQTPPEILRVGDNIPEKPADPMRPADPDTAYAFAFVDWSTASNGDSDFEGFGEPATDDVTVYAQWRHIYVFESEYVDLSINQGGAGWGGLSPLSLIVKDTEVINANASNGYFLCYLYSYGIEMRFDIVSDREIDAILTLRLSAEMDGTREDGMLIFDDEEYLLKVNGTEIRYGEIMIENPYHPMDVRKKPFEDVVMVTIHLVAGTNRISLITNNNRSMGGTMSAAAPMVDCIKIDTTAALTWKPVLSNLNYVG